MPYGLYSIDSLYLTIVLPAVIFALIAQNMVNRRFITYSKVRCVHNLSGAQAAEQVLRTHGVYDVRIEQTAGNLTDHYDPRAKTIRLSPGVHDSVSVAAVGIAAHEAGHAVQHAQGYGPIRLREFIIPVTRIGSSLSMPLILIGLVFYSEIGNFLFLVGIALFGLATFFQLVTLPVEFNASRRALETLEQTRMLNDEELKGAKSVLWAAAMTYVAALAVSLSQLFRLMMLSGRRRR